MTSPAVPFNPEGIIGTLSRYRVDYIVVGGISAVLRGASMLTGDLDIVHSRTPENVERMLTALAELDAVYRAQPSRRLKPNSSDLLSPGHQLLQTKLGQLDIVGEIGAGNSYDDLLPHSSLMEVGPDSRVHVLSLSKLIELKTHAGRPKDQAVLAILHATLKASQDENAG